MNKGMNESILILHLAEKLKELAVLCLAYDYHTVTCSIRIIDHPCTIIAIDITVC